MEGRTKIRDAEARKYSASQKLRYISPTDDFCNYSLYWIYGQPTRRQLQLGDDRKLGNSYSFKKESEIMYVERWKQIVSINLYGPCLEMMSLTVQTIFAP